MRRKLRYGMVGGGPGAFIGEAHRRSINLDGQAELAAGCFSRTFEKTLETGDTLGVERDRLYPTFEAMAKAEAEREDRIDFAVVVTPNYMHYAACKAFLEAGIHVSCDKPLTVTSEQGIELKKLAQEKGLQFLVTYGYSGHVTAMQIKQMIADGEIGRVRTVMAEYPQGWLAFGDQELGKQGAWRIDPEMSGKSNCLGDIGTHIENTVAQMTGLKIKRLLAKMEIIADNRKLDDNSTVLVEYDNGASGVYWSSQIAIGHDNGLRVRIYGDKGSLMWFQENPEVFQWVKKDGTLIEMHRGHSGIVPSAAKYQRLPSGHTEGWFEAMANLYANFIDCVHAQNDGTFRPEMIEYPTIDDGIVGVQFIEACIKSSDNGNIWVEM